MAPEMQARRQSGSSQWRQSWRGKPHRRPILPPYSARSGAAVHADKPSPGLWTGVFGNAGHFTEMAADTGVFERIDSFHANLSFYQNSDDVQRTWIFAQDQGCQGIARRRTGRHVAQAIPKTYAEIAQKPRSDLFSSRHDAEKIHILFRKPHRAQLVAVAAERFQGVQPHAAEDLFHLVAPGMDQIDQLLRTDFRVEPLCEVRIIGGDTPWAFAGIATLAESAAQRQQGRGAEVDGIGAQERSP